MLKVIEEKLCRISAGFGWLRLPVLLLGIIAAGFGFYVSLYPDVENNNQLILPAVLVFCWCLLIFCLLTIFPLVPAQAPTKQGFFQRKLTQLRHLLRMALVAAFVILTVSLLLVSYKLITTGIG